MDFVEQEKVCLNQFSAKPPTSVGANSGAPFPHEYGLSSEVRRRTGHISLDVSTGEDS